MPESRRLIVNADDFALHPLVNRAILLAHREGIVTSTTILAGGRAFLDDIEELKNCPKLGLGVHLCLVDQKSVLRPEEIPSLVDSEGRFCSSYAVFLKKYFLKQIRMDHVRRELEAQVGRIRDVGLPITHLDSHQHLHLLPGIAEIASNLTRKFSIRCIRVPSERMAGRQSAIPFFRRLQGRLVFSMAQKRRREFDREGLHSADHFFGFGQGGSFLLDDWLKLLPHLPVGVSEVMVHPGSNTNGLRTAFDWGYHWGEELQALTDPQLRLLLGQHKIQLINYGALV